MRFPLKENVNRKIQFSRLIFIAMIGHGSNKKRQSFPKCFGTLLINIIFSAVIRLPLVVGEKRSLLIVPRHYCVVAFQSGCCVTLLHMLGCVL